MLLWENFYLESKDVRTSSLEGNVARQTPELLKDIAVYLAR